MTKEETLKILAVLKAAYPAFYSKQSKNELEATVNIWYARFVGDDYTLVNYALGELIDTHTGFPPDIAAVKIKMREIQETATGELNVEELWYKLKRAVSNSTYGAAEEFEKLPPILKQYICSPSALHELAMIDTETLNTVTHGQFLKQIAALKEQEQQKQRLPEEIKARIVEQTQNLNISTVANAKCWKVMVSKNFESKNIQTINLQTLPFFTKNTTQKGVKL